MSANARQAMTEFKVDTENLYREESVTDLKVASIRVLIPIHPDGRDELDRDRVYVGSTQLMSPEGPIPLQAPLPAETLEEAMAVFPEAMAVFPEAMRRALNDMVEKNQGNATTAENAEYGKITDYHSRSLSRPPLKNLVG
mgnify:CR=1 FL=1